MYLKDLQYTRTHIDIGKYVQVCRMTCHALSMPYNELQMHDYLQKKRNNNNTASTVNTWVTLKKVDIIRSAQLTKCIMEWLNTSYTKTILSQPSNKQNKISVFGKTSFDYPVCSCMVTSQTHQYVGGQENCAKSWYWSLECVYS